MSAPTVTVYPTVDPTPRAKRKRHKHRDRVGKRALMEVIIAGYGVGIGPALIGNLTGYSERSVRYYAESLGMVFGQGMHSAIPNPVPPEFLIALMKAGAGNYSFTRREA